MLPRTRGIDVSALGTPFWIVTDRRAGVPTPVVLPCAPTHVVAFTDPDKARGFVRGNEVDCEIGLVTFRTVSTVVEVYRLLGVKGFCVDPVDDWCAFAVTLQEVEQSARSQMIEPDEGHVRDWHEPTA